MNNTLLSTKTFIEKLIQWQLNDWSMFLELDTKKQEEYIQRILDYKDGKTPKAPGLSDEKFEELKKLASFKLEYFVQIMEQIGLKFDGNITVEDQEKFLKDLL